MKERVDALFVPWSKKGMPGAAIGVVQHGRDAFCKGYGLAHIDKHVPNKGHTSFLLASLTKQFTAMAVMILVEHGELTYEHRLAEFMPKFPPYARAITVRHLLHHTAGLAEYEELFAREGKIDPCTYPRSSKTPPSEYEPDAQLTIDLLARQECPLFNPGEQFRYTNSNYVVLARIVEIASGLDFPAFMKKQVFDRTGMRHSNVPVGKFPKVPKRAISYSWRKRKYGDIDYTPFNKIYGDDGIFSTIDDLMTWDKALYGTKLVKQSTLQEAFVSGKLKCGTTTHYGFGWSVGPDFVSHSGAWLGYRTCIIRYLDQRLTVIVLANCAELNAASMAADIAELYLNPKPC